MKTKWLARSKTLWGAVVMALPVIAQVAGLDFSPEDAATIGTSGVAFIDAAFELAGAALVLWGRFTASDKVTVLPRPIGSSSGTLRAAPAATLAALALLGLLAGGCAGLTPQAQADVAMASACDSFSNALRTATTFKAQMSAEQIAAVDHAVSVAQPACHEFRANPEAASESLVNEVRDALRAVVTANQEVQP